jgi:hypothetical protein
MRPHVSMCQRVGAALLLLCGGPSWHALLLALRLRHLEAERTSQELTPTQQAHLNTATQQQTRTRAPGQSCRSQTCRDSVPAEDPPICTRVPLFCTRRCQHKTSMWTVATVEGVKKFREDGAVFAALCGLQSCKKRMRSAKKRVSIE